MNHHAVKLDDMTSSTAKRAGLINYHQEEGVSLGRVLDIFLFKHSTKVAEYAANIAKALNLSRGEIFKIRVAAMLHDIGKYLLNWNIVNKPGRLSKKEWIEVKKHPTVSANIVSKTGLFNDITDIIRHHHERFGGGGYPNPGRKGDCIPIGSRIIAVADSYEAMTSNRPYRKRPLTQREAIMELKRCVGTQFDPRIVAAFIRTIEG